MDVGETRLLVRVWTRYWAVVSVGLEQRSGGYRVGWEVWGVSERGGIACRMEIGSLDV